MPADVPSLIRVQSRRSVSIPFADLVRDGALEIYPQIETGGYFTVQFRHRVLQLTAGPHIGHIPINPRITIEVQPRFPIDNLARVIEVAQSPIHSIGFFQRPYGTLSEATPSILEFLASNLAQAFEEIEVHGLHRRYVPHTENTSNPRGHIHISHTVIRNFSRGVKHKVYSTLYDQTIDTPYNRLLKYALWSLTQRLLRLPSHNRTLMQKLNATLNHLDAVSLDPSDDVIRSVSNDLVRGTIPSGRQYYRRALQIALTVVAGKGIELAKPGNDVDLSTYTIDFEKLFEAYLRQVLRNRLSVLRPEVRVRDGNNEARRRLFDGKSAHFAQPDIVIDLPGDEKLLIVDAKYKDRISRDDIDQVVTYGCSYHAKPLVLVHQCSPPSSNGKHLLGTIGGMSLYTYAFDLMNPSLEEEEQAFADSMLATLESSDSPT